MSNAAKSDLQWKHDMEDDAKRMSSYDFAAKYGKYNLGIWDAVNSDLQPYVVEEEVMVILGQTRKFFMDCQEKVKFNDQTKSWLKYTTDKISKILFDYNSKYNLTDINSGVNDKN